MNDNNQLKHTDEEIPEETPEEIPEDTQVLVDKIKNNPEAIRQVLHQVKISQSFSHSGPLPMASELERYNNIVPNAAERILSMAEKEQTIKEDSIKKELDQRDEILRQKNKGQNFGLGVVILFFIMSFYLAFLGATTASATLMGGGLVSIVGIFVIGKWKN